MAKVKDFLKRRKKLVIVLAILLILVGVLVSCFVSVSNAVSDLMAAAGNADVTVLAQESLEKVVTANGTLESRTSRQVSTTQSAEVSEIFVSVGDYVNAGDVLCQLDTTDIDRDIDNARQALNNSYATNSLSLQQAQRRLQDSKDERDRQTKELDTAVSNAKADRDNWWASLQAQQEIIDAAQSVLDNLDQTDPSYPVYWAAGMADLENAKANYVSVEAQYNVVAQAYETAKTTRDSTVRTLDSTVQTNQDTVDSLRVADSTSTLRNTLEAYERQRDQMTIKAPVAGTITEINAEVGVSALGGSSATTLQAASNGLFVIQDMENLQVPASIAEYDVVDIETGMEVAVTSDALLGQSWTGRVTSISPTASDSMGNFEVIIQITSPVGELTSGMSTRLNIIADSVQNAYAVPFDAVVTNEAGQQVVYVYEPASADSSAAAAGVTSNREIVVETGLETDYYVQILSSELEDGMMILNDPLGVNVNQAFNMFGM